MGKVLLRATGNCSSYSTPECNVAENTRESLWGGAAARPGGEEGGEGARRMEKVRDNRKMKKGRQCKSGREFTFICR